MNKIFAIFLAIIFLQSNLANAAKSNWQENQSGGAKTRLIASFYKNNAGETKFIAGIQFKIASGWKIYGHGADNIGLPPSIDISKSKNIASEENLWEILWPKSKIGKEEIGDQVFSYNYYDKEIILPIILDLKNPQDLVNLNLDLNYGLCKDICIPANENFILEIKNGEIDLEALEEIQKFFPKNLLPKTDSSIGKKATYNPKKAIFLMILFGIIGGAILNIMPCVLPVLSIKLLSIINHPNSSNTKIRFSFISTIFGILSCFILFATLATIIKITGNSFGWGLQFQNPYFLIFLIVVLLAFITNLLGIFEINFSQKLATILDKRISDNENKNKIFITNFLSGILAVLLATPCSAPFLGAAISFALVENIAIIFTIFIAIGIGFASPYFILLAMPNLVKLLPKPGNWMSKIKQLMALFLVATIIWLLYILQGNLGTISVISILILLLILVLCIKIKSLFFKSLAIVLVLATIFSLPIEFAKKNSLRYNSTDYFWGEFDEAKIYQEIAKGNVVIIDITANWCLTCKFNKLTVLQDKEIVDKLKEGNIVAMRGDITKPNDDIMKYLQKNNRFAIPFNAVYGPNAKNGLLTSELLTKKELLKLINQAQ